MTHNNSEIEKLAEEVVERNREAVQRDIDSDWAGNYGGSPDAFSYYERGVRDGLKAQESKWVTLHAAKWQGVIQYYTLRQTLEQAQEAWIDSLTDFEEASAEFVEVQLREITPPKGEQE